MEDSTLD